MPTAPAAICILPMAGILWVLMCGRLAIRCRSRWACTRRMLSSITSRCTVTAGVSRSVIAVMDEPPRGRPRRCGPRPRSLIPEVPWPRTRPGIDSAMLSRSSRAPIGVGVLVVLVMLVAPAQVPAQENFEIQVYGSETVPPGTTMVELHSNVAAVGTTRTENDVLRTQGAFHETLEITQGWTSWLETGFYVFTSIQPDTTWEWVGSHIRPRVRAPESWELPVGLSLSLEVGYQRREFSADTWTLELRPIIDKKLDGWYASFNPVFARSLKGEGVNEERGFEFTPNAKVAYDVTSKVSAGL